MLSYQSHHFPSCSRLAFYAFHTSDALGNKDSYADTWPHCVCTHDIKYAWPYLLWPQSETNNEI